MSKGRYDEAFAGEDVTFETVPSTCCQAANQTFIYLKNRQSSRRGEPLNAKKMTHSLSQHPDQSGHKHAGVNLVMRSTESIMVL